MDASLQEVARLHPASLSLTEALAPLSEADMLLPEGEPAVTVGMFMELFTPSGSAGVFRVNAVTTAVGGEGGQRITLQHALCTLSDDVVVGYAEASGDLRETAEALLARQSRVRWQAGAMPEESAALSWENENLLTALLSLTTPLEGGYMWRFDFSTAPWTLSLEALPEEICEVRAGRSLSQARITIDRTDLCTRLYPFGYGEGADQLNIRKVNGGLRYLTADTAPVWGVVKRIWTDPSITRAATLKAAARRMLERCKHPVVTVEVDADELCSLTGEPLDRFRPGSACRLPLPAWGVSMVERVTCVHRPDVYGDPTRVTLTLANRAASCVDDLSALARQSAVSLQYTQGAPSESSIHFSDNCDPEHPARLRFFLDEDAVHVNKARIAFSVEKFRGYARSASGGGEGTATTPVSVVTRSATTGAAQSDGEGHVHSLQVSLDLPALEVDVSAHTHATRYGIYEAGEGASVTVAVDGTVLPAETVASGDFDAAAFLSAGEDGRILRGAWHEVTFTPDGLARVVADLHVRTFIRSLTGANL